MDNIGNHKRVSELCSLLVLRHSNNSVGIVQKVNDNGNLIYIKPDQSGSNIMLCIDSSAGSFAEFYSDFYNQLKNPANYSFFKVREYEARETAVNLQSYVESSTDSEKKDLTDYAVSIDTVNFIRNRKPADKRSSVANGSVSDQPSEIGSSDQYRFQLNDVPWESLAEIGLDREKLERFGILDDLLKGYKTDMLIPVLLMDGDSASNVDARLQLRLNDNGEVAVRIQRVQDRPDFDELFLGHRFTEEDEMNLLNCGNMGRAVELLDDRTGELIPSLISMDRVTNELISLRMDFVRIPVVVCGVQLDSEQQRILKEGKPLFVEDMISRKGKAFSATLQFNEEKHSIEFLFENDLKGFVRGIQGTEKSIPTSFRGKALRKWQIEKLKKGECAYIDGLESKSGKKYQGYISFNKVRGLLDFSFKNPKKL